MKIRTARDLFMAMDPMRRAAMHEMLENWLWKFATATACAATKEGRVMPTLPREIANELSSASLEVFVRESE